MTRKIRAAAAIALIGATALTAAGCSAGSDAASSDGKVTMTFWHNSTTGPGKAFWEKTVKDFEQLHPNVTIKIQAIQNEDLDGKLQTALNSGSAPDVFLQRGGGKMAAMVQAGQLMDISGSIGKTAKAQISDGAFKGYESDGKTYAMPVDVNPEGIWYSQDLFEQAGIKGTPTTMAELNADIAKLKAADIQPVAVGAKDAWPAAHWYYNFALRACSEKTLNGAAKDLKFTNSCWEQAGKDTKAFFDTKPFNDGYLTTAAQQGAGSSAGLVANHKAAMELMGAWDPGVISSLTPDGKPLADLGFFPFPEVSGGKGAPGSMMGAVDGYSCSAKAPKVPCTQFLNYMTGKDVQEAYYKAFNAIPANQSAQSVVTEPYLKNVLAAYNKAPFVSNYLDTLYGQNVGNALNTSVVNLLAGKGSVDDIVTTVNQAAAKG
ncbi:carbohydrate ABC transporter substrate-binding protein (CUT1 family) [Curtobacterium sp. PhB130]|uniref:ABC transporter substrate-binding protein n=1 Tax=unclassified Curtobacterium TaxID=257496 RepID=UPI000F4C8F94|nr:MULTISPECIES: extracellular solute-binding protein [unclassified Curtobacterium]ROP64813.1 carbohydrate ABC transporter substrate-binding protein (CUT1 family) [Curtobacterium sp. ZW137]ROS75105.1 carbohydrate ABC transporter substrate-binding protein (CUT1 family) [Curtobacterium sp. PhB130]TCK63733.1 carbohydrate ABC transporter substrate-binding protein (CUT1 family) [Curtobacterium sp. PhB136]